MPCENDPFKKYIQGFDGKVDNQSNPDDVTELSQLFREIFPDTSDYTLDDGIILINPNQTFIGHNQIVPSDEHYYEYNRLIMMQSGVCSELITDNKAPDGMQRILGFKDGHFYIDFAHSNILDTSLITMYRTPNGYDIAIPLTLFETYEQKLTASEDDFNRYGEINFLADGQQLVDFMDTIYHDIHAKITPETRYLKIQIQHGEQEVFTFWETMISPKDIADFEHTEDIQTHNVSDQQININSNYSLSIQTDGNSYALYLVNHTTNDSITLQIPTPDTTNLRAIKDVLFNPKNLNLSSIEELFPTKLEVVVGETRLTF